MRINDVRARDDLDNEILKFDNAPIQLIGYIKSGEIAVYDQSGCMRLASVPMDYVIKLALERVKEIKSERQG